MPSFWLFKEEPAKYSFADLLADGRTRWDGVRNNLALKYLRQARPGDRFLYYHTGGERAVVGVGEIVSEPYIDPAGEEQRLAVVDVRPLHRLPRPVTLAELKAQPEFEGSPLVRIGRLSVVPITPEQWACVERLAAS